MVTGVAESGAKEKVMAKIAIVTGASRGIGREIAKRLAKDGFSVVVNYAGNAAKAQEVVNEIVGDGGTAIPIQADISKFDDVQNLFTSTKRQYGQIDTVVNNAGIMGLSPIAKGGHGCFRQNHPDEFARDFHGVRSGGAAHL
jgi:3-oxoacyl-[acyl-carrier protein] reductase